MARTGYRGVPTAIAVHGMHLESEGWESVMWGQAPHQLGRIPKGILEAHRCQAQLLIFGTGASERDSVKEAHYIVRYLWANFHRLENFTAFQNLNLGHLQRWLQGIIVPETTSQNTREEVRVSCQMLLERRIEQLIVVSNPDHLPRALMEVMSELFGNDYPATLRHAIYATPSDVCFAGSEPGNTVIFEFPHRNDRPLQPLYLYAKRILEVPRDQLDPFLEEFTQLLQKYGA